MDRDLIIQLVLEADVKPLLYDGKLAIENLDVFTALVEAHERYRICEMLRERHKQEDRHNYYGFIANMIEEQK